MFLIVFIFFSFPGFCTELKHWPAKEAKILENLIKKNAHKGEYAVFDADNTIWFRDLEESLLPYLENKDLLTRRTLDPSLKLIPFHAEDTLVSYAYKLYDIDHKIGYPWIAQVFCGFTLGELKVHVDNLFALNGKAMPCKYWSEGKLTEYYPETPTIYPGQIELINKLNENGIEVYVVTAAHEELVRMVVSDPKYKINVKPENVIGVTTLLKDRETNEVTTARLQIEKGHFFDEEYTKEDHYKKEMTPYIWSPNTMYVGKMAAIKDYIHPVKKPILVAGDAPSDHWMLFESDYSKGGVKVWVNRKEKYWKKTQEAMAERAELEKEAGLKPSADKNWIMVHPKDIGIK
jgi:hypothetical protein